MNSMSNGFLYTLGFGWALTECCLLAVAGSFLPLILFTLAFVVVFSVLGCIRLSDASVEKFGSITAVVLALVLVIFTAQTFVAGSIGLGLVKLVFALVFVAGAVVVFTRKSAASGHAHHH